MADDQGGGQLPVDHTWSDPTAPPELVDTTAPPGGIGDGRTDPAGGGEHATGAAGQVPGSTIHPTQPPATPPLGPAEHPGRLPGAPPQAPAGDPAPSWPAASTSAPPPGRHAAPARHADPYAQPPHQALADGAPPPRRRPPFGLVAAVACATALALGCLGVGLWFALRPGAATDAGARPGSGSITARPASPVTIPPMPLPSRPEVTPEPTEPTEPTSTPAPTPTTRTRPQPGAILGPEDGPVPGAREQPTVPGWQVVVNPELGVAYDVPADWHVRPPTTSAGVEYQDPEGPFGYTTVAQSGTAVAGRSWCVFGTDGQGHEEAVSAGTVGSRQHEASSPAAAAEQLAPLWVFGAFTEPDSEAITYGRATALTTSSGIEGRYSVARSTRHPAVGRCGTNGKAVAFAFTHPTHGLEVVSFYGITGVEGEVPDATVRRILTTVRVHGSTTTPAA